MVERGTVLKPTDGPSARFPRRTAFVATSYPTDPDDAAGHFVRAEVLAAARAVTGDEGSARDADDGSADDEVHVVAPRPWAHDPGVTAHPAGGEALFTWPGAVARVRERPLRAALALPFGAGVARAIRAIRPTHVVAHWLVPSAFPLSLAVPSASRPTSLEIVCHGADVRLLLGLPAPARAAIVRAVCRPTTRVRFVASSLRDALLASLDERTAEALATIATVTPPRVDVSDAAAAPRGDAYVVASGRLVAAKRVDLAIAAARRAGTPLVVVGDGPERARLEEAARGADVTFTGKLGRRHALGYLRGARALLHPSEVDAAPTVVLEALALGVPVVTAGAGDTAAWARTEPCIVVAERATDALAAALSTLPPPVRD